MTWDHWDMARPINSNNILKACCEVFGVTKLDLIKTRGTENVRDARMCYYVLSRKLTKQSFSAIGGVIAKDHANVIKGIVRAEELMSINDPLKYKIEKTEEQLLNKHI